MVRFSAFSLSFFTRRLSLLSISLALYCLSSVQLHAAPTTLGAATFETYISDDGEPARINTLLEKVFKKAELDIQLQVMRQAFLGSSVLTGKLDGEFAYINLGEDDSNYVLSDIYLPIYLYAVSKDADVEAVKLFPHLKGNRAAIENRFANTPSFRLLKDIKWSRNPTTFDAFRQLADDRAPYLITTQLLAQELNILLANDNEETLHFSAKPLAKTGFQLAISKNVANAESLVARFNKAMSTMQDNGELNQPLALAWLTKDVNGDGVADFIGHSSTTTITDVLDTAYSLDGKPTSESSMFYVDGEQFASLEEARAALPAIKSISPRASLLDKTTYQLLLRRW
ncbi:transporter substrate-binding domain-containing protein [Alteromonas sp. ALT199]|uniref:substrate-binding periplasmic protein n=1 Tax=unclassified Alteromonas TaxID=2614992 RepID=UPI00044CA9FD|nr:transporter substrate-binding domain-containing protein [Alteromonas sp. ALT199]MBT3136515.1 transporter substrate-binding domain-containing protein [Alteromonas sp. ALT199]